MSKIASLIFAILFSISSISNCHAQDSTDMTVDGRVTRIDISQSKLTIKNINELTFSVPINASIKNTIYDIKLSDIEPGYYVVVEYHKDSSGNLIATRIMVENQEQ